MGLASFLMGVFTKKLQLQANTTASKRIRHTRPSHAELVDRRRQEFEQMKAANPRYELVYLLDGRKRYARTNDAEALMGVVRGLNGGKPLELRTVNAWGQTTAKARC